MVRHRRLTLSPLFDISNQKVNDMFDEGNEKQNLDKLEKLVAGQNAKHKFWKEQKD